MITGTVNTYQEAVIHLILHGLRGEEWEIEAVVDTGFTGSLSLPPSLITGLKLPYLRRGRAILADGSVSDFDVYEGTVIWDGQLRQVIIDAVDTDPLVGMRLLRGYELTIQVIDGGNVSIQALSPP